MRTVFPDVHLTAHGSALKITLSANIQRTYSVPVSVDYPQKSVAMAACARLALEQDALEFIKHGDGLECPIVVPFEGAEALPPRKSSPFVSTHALIFLPAPPPTVTTLQVFYAALPKPMPDIIGTKPSGEINAIAWLNSTVQVLYVVSQCPCLMLIVSFRPPKVPVCR